MERFALAIERPFTWLAGAPHLNPFYHTGTLAVFLWLMVALTGLYLTLFYQFGFEAAYQSVAKMEGQLIAHVIRAVHRYASGTAMIATLLHGFRLFFMDRFRGPRWLAWVSGVVMAALLWLDGVTGYWLIWDQQAQLITAGFANFLDRYTPFGAAFAASLLAAERTDQSWIFIGILFAVHILLFGVVGLFFWWHILRLSQPKYLPPRYWLIGVGAVVLLISTAFPLGMLPKADFWQLPGPVTLDPFYLFFLPLSLRPAAGWLWAGLTILFVVASLIPWLTFRRLSSPPVSIDKQQCAGCGTCAADCPYKAITMRPRAEGEARRLVAEVNPRLCVACGVCLGACDKGVISLDGLSAESLWQLVEARLARARRQAPEGKVRLVFTCERHAAQGARPYLERAAQSGDDGRLLEVIPLPCVAAAPPNLIARALDSGAAEALVVGCPPDDCARRDGNLWTEGRLTRQRRPRLKWAYAHAPIATAWLAPDTFALALRAPQAARPAQAGPFTAFRASSEPGRRGQMSPKLGWRNFGPAFALMALLFAAQVRLTTWPFQPYPGNAARVQVVLADPSKPFTGGASQFPAEFSRWPIRLVFEADGRLIFDQPYAAADLFAGRARPVFKEVPLAPGEHHLRLSFALKDDKEDQIGLAVFDQTVNLHAGQILILPVGEG